MTDRIVIDNPSPNPNPSGDENQKPDWCPDKFWDAEKGAVNSEAMAKSYSELEKTNSQKPTPDPQNADQNKVEQALEAKGVEFTKFQNEYLANGQLSETSYQELAKAGIPKEMVDSYIAGQEVQAQTLQNEIFGSVGGEDKYGAMIEWAKTNLSKGEIDAFNSAVSGTPEQAKLAVQGLFTKYTQTNGQSPSLVSGTQTPGAGDVYETWAQVQKDMAKPEYRKDSAFREKVIKKLERSNPQ